MGDSSNTEDPKDATGPDQLASVRIPIQEAGAFVASAIQACDELLRTTLAADIRRWLAEAAELIGRPEVRSYPARQHGGRLLLERTESQAPTLWARWRVVDAAGGDLVGSVAEVRKWLGHGYGSPTFTVVYDPAGSDGPALCCSEGHPTPMGAVAAMLDHLEQR